MPYVCIEDRVFLDLYIKERVDLIIPLITDPVRLAPEYMEAFGEITSWFEKRNGSYTQLGMLNYVLTRFIQEVPKEMFNRKIWVQELQYWIYAVTVDALIKFQDRLLKYHFRVNMEAYYGMVGVVEDVKDEYKWRVNRPYEAQKILENGDCYDTPYFTKLVPIYKQDKLVGHIDVYVKRDENNINQDILDGKLKLEV